MRNSLNVFIFIVFMLIIVPVLSACGTEINNTENNDATSNQNINANNAENENNENNDGGNENIESNEDNEATSDQDKYKVGILAPAVTHGWVAAVAYHAEERAKELSDDIEYQIQTSSNAEEMTSQLDDLMTWGAEAIVAFPQWEGMEVPIQTALDADIHVVNFDIEIDAEGVYRVAGDNEDMGVQGAHYIVDKIGTEGNVVILEVPTSGSVSELRKKGFLETIEEIAPDINLETYATKFTRED